MSVSNADDELSAVVSCVSAPDDGEPITACNVRHALPPDAAIDDLRNTFERAGFATTEPFARAASRSRLRGRPSSKSSPRMTRTHSPAPGSNERPARISSCLYPPRHTPWPTRPRCRASWRSPPRRTSDQGIRDGCAGSTIDQGVAPRDARRVTTGRGGRFHASTRPPRSPRSAVRRSRSTPTTAPRRSFPPGHVSAGAAATRPAGSSAPGGPLLDGAARDRIVDLVSRLTSLECRPLAARGTYSFYRRPGHHFGLHRDIHHCDVATITCIERSGRGDGGELLVFPRSSGAPLRNLTVGHATASASSVARRSSFSAATCLIW